MPSEPPAAQAFPVPWGERAPWTRAGVRGVRFAPLDGALEALLERWVVSGRIEAPDGAPYELLKRDVVRVGGLVAKLFDPPPLLRRLSARDTAQRAAALALAIRPIPSPRPLLAVGGVGPRGERSLLVSEFVAGSSLAEAWEESPAARDALPDFLAAMHERGVHHGDLHPGNLLWDGARLMLIDVTALRRGLHRLLARRLARAQWARLVLYLGDLEGLRAAFLRYAARRGWRHGEREWARVLDHARRLAAARRVLPPKAPQLS